MAAKMGRPTPTVMSPQDFNAQITDAPGHNGIAADVAPLIQPDLPSLVDKLAADQGTAIVILDQVTDPHNIGAIIRSAAAFGALAVVGQDRHAPDETAIMAKIASGGMEHVPYIKVTNISRTLTWLDGHDFLSIGLDERGAGTLASVAMGPRVAFVMGAEGSGLRRLVSERCQKLVRLPTRPPIASLNVSNAVAASLYEWRRLEAGGA
ncbi:MAG: RNA methyltransferase [Pseudomonadota bacterium]